MDSQMALLKVGLMAHKWARRVSMEGMVTEGTGGCRGIMAGSALATTELSHDILNPI